MRTMRSAITTAKTALSNDAMLTLSSRGLAQMTSRHPYQEDKILLNPAREMNGIKKLQFRSSVTHKKTNLSKGASLNTKLQRNLHQALAQPELRKLIPHFVQEVRKIDCEVAEYDDKEEIVQFVCKHFLRREPLIKTLNISAEEARAFVTFNVEDALKDKSSFVARDERGKICGIRLNAVGPQEEMGAEIRSSPRLRSLTQFLEHVDGLFPEEIHTSRFMRHIAICVDPDIARSGVGTLMMQKSVEYSEKHRLRYMAAMCSGKIATGLALKVGFRIVKQVPYNSYVEQPKPCDLFDDGHPLFGEYKPFQALAKEQECANIMIKHV